MAYMTEFEILRPHTCCGHKGLYSVSLRFVLPEKPYLGHMTQTSSDLHRKPQRFFCFFFVFMGLLFVVLIAYEQACLLVFFPQVSDPKVRFFVTDILIEASVSFFRLVNCGLGEKYSFIRNITLWNGRIRDAGVANFSSIRAKICQTNDHSRSKSRPFRVC